MSKLRLPGSSLLDRCIGRSTFQYTQAIKIPSFEHNLNYDSFIKTLSKYEPSKYRHIWYYSTPFGIKKFLFFSMFSTNNYNINKKQKKGRANTCRLNLGSSKRTVCLHLDKDDDNPTNIEVYEYCVGSIRQNLLLIQNTPLLPSKLNEFLLNIQYRLACYFAEKWPHSVPDLFFDSLYRSKLMDSKTFTSTQPNFFPKWCSSISIVRVLKAKQIDINQLIDKLNKENNNNELKGKSKVNLGKDVDIELDKENESENKMDPDHPMHAMKDEYQSDFIRHYTQLSRFENNYQCDEMYLVLSTRYAISGSSIFRKILFIPHWITVKLLSDITHNKILSDLANNLAMISHKDAQNVDDKESHWHADKQSPSKNKKVAT